MSDAIKWYAERCGIDLTEEQVVIIQRLENHYAGRGDFGFTDHLFRLMSHWNVEDITSLPIGIGVEG